MSESIVNLAYLISALMFIWGIKGLSHPRRAFNGNIVGSLGMLLAVIVTLLDREILRFDFIIAGLILGSLIGLALALRVKMTAMPQLVAAFNGFGGGASALVAAASVYMSTSVSLGGSISVVLSGLIGSVTFFGSLVAYIKLEGLVDDKYFKLKSQKLLVIVFTALVLLFSVLSAANPSSFLYYWLLVLFASGLGILLVIPVGGADMPVMIALLNSYSGLAASATGFVLENNVLIIAGSLVGASGIILTKIMCQAMNRSLLNVLSGLSDTSSSGDSLSADEVYKGKITSTSAEEVSMLLDTAEKVVVVPGYGMAVAQAQHVVRDLHDLLESKGVSVEFAIHPVAGRMPGHMNVLLADADISYDKMKTMDEINSSFSQVDVVFVIGANDIVNPAARNEPNSPIAGMPILDVDKARTVVVIKRSLSPGYAGIPNPLFALDNTLMFFGDGKKAIEELITAVKEG